MSILDHIHRCNAHDLARYRPFSIGYAQVGWIGEGVADTLAALPGFVVKAEQVELTAIDFEARSAALANAAEALVSAGFVRNLRGELYGVKTLWTDAALATVDRGAVSAFGLRSFGVHLNGWTEGASGISMWIGTRSMTATVDPGKLDNIVAGGQPYGLTLAKNLAKEAAEEADIPSALIAQAKPSGAISYVMETPSGIRPDVLFCFDLQLPAAFTPRNTDGETSKFDLIQANAVQAIVAKTDHFKFNCNLVIAQFLMRHGILNPDNEPDYQAIAKAL